jgi:hypothetical protein
MHVKAVLSGFLLSGLCAVVIRAQEPSPSSVEARSAAEIPKGYEVGEKSISPDGRFAILYPVQDEESQVMPDLPNVLVRLNPYAVLAKIAGDGVPQGRRGESLARWNDNSIVAIWRARKWGIGDLAIYEIEKDKVKRVQPIWREARRYFARHFRNRFLKKYPKEYDSFTFVSDDDERRGHEFEFQGRKLLLNLFADNKPNLAGGPHWTAELHATWNIDTAKFEKVDFRPGKIEVRPDLD